jgi:tartrate dehydratase alpha subunit/fumarate hydratase class I-like protein
MLHLEGDGIGVHFVDLGGGSENLAAVGLCSGGKQDDSFDNQLSECILISLANECGCVPRFVLARL